MITLNNLILIFQDIAARHNQVNDFECSQDFNIAADDAPTYPIIVVNPTGANLPKTDAGYTSFSTTFDFQCIDLVSKDNSNRNDVLSDTMQIINDCVSELSQHPYYNENSIDLINNVSFEPLRGKYDEDVDGWKISLELQTPNKVSWCGAPMETLNGFTPPSSLDATVENSTASFRVEVPAGTTKVLDDEQLQLVDVNGDLIQAYSNPLYEDLLIEVPVFGDVKSGIAYQRPLPTGQTISYRTGDDAWQLVNNPYNEPPSNPLYCQSLVDFYTLKHDNEFGNRFRFTDELGAQVYANNYFIDNLTGLGWSNLEVINNDTWNNAIDSANNSNLNNYNDWYIPNLNELNSLLNNSVSKGWVSKGWDYSPLNISSSRFYWTSTTSGRSSSSAMNYANATGNYYASIFKTNTSRYHILVRKHF